LISEDGAGPEAESEYTGVHLEGYFKGQFRAAASVAPRNAFDRVRMWTAEQGTTFSPVTLRQTMGTDVIQCFDEVHDKIVSTMCLQRVPAEYSHDAYPQENIIMGFTDGTLRVYRKKPPATLKYSPGKGDCGLRFHPGSCIVSEVLPRSSAELAGFEPGAVIAAVNNTEVTDGKQAKELIEEKKTCTVKISGYTVTQDGTHEPQYEMVAENKKHIKEITCIVSYTDARGEPAFATGGRDWKIYFWKWDVTRCPLKRNDKGEWDRCIDSLGGFWCREQFLEKADDYAAWHEAAPGDCKLKLEQVNSESQNAVRCMAHLSTPGLQVLYTGGEDNVIRCMDMEYGAQREAHPHPTRKVQGFPIRPAHKDCPTALAATETYLYSGGRDGSLKVWHSETGYPVALGGLPGNSLFSSRGSAVMSLLAVNKQVWSGWADGILRVWAANRKPHGVWVVDAEEGAEVPHRHMPSESSDAYDAETHPPLVRGTKVSVAYWRPKSAWVELENGAFIPKKNIREQDPHDIEHGYLPWLLAQRKEHVGGAITGLTVAQEGLTGTPVWAAQQNEVTLYYTESDRMDGGHDDGFLAQEQFKIGKIHGLRDKVLEGYEENRKERRRHDLWERRVYRRLNVISNSLARENARSQKLYYMTRLSLYLAAKTVQERQQLLAGLMLRSMGLGLHFIYYDKLRNYVALSQENKRKQKCLNSLLRCTDKGLSILYWQHVQHFARQKWAYWKKRDAAIAILRNTEQGMRAIYYQKYLRWTSRKRGNKKRKMLAECLLAQSEKGLKSLFWARLKEFGRREAQNNSRKILINVFEGLQEKNILLNFYKKLANFRARQVHKRKENVMAVFLQGASDTFKVRDYYRKCFAWVQGKHRDRTRQQIEEVSANVRRLQDRLAGLGNLTQEDIDRERKELEDAIARVRAENEAIPGQIKEIKRLTAELEKEVLMTYDPPGQTARQRLAALLLHIKANACNCKHNYEEIKRMKLRKDKDGKEWCKKYRGEARTTEEAMEHPLSPCRLLEDGFMKVVTALQESYDTVMMAESTTARGRRPETDGQAWEMPVDVITDMSSKLFERAANGIVEVIVAWDQIMSRDRHCVEGLKTEEEIDNMQRVLGRYCVEHKTKGSLVKNASWVITIVSKMVKKRHKKDEEMEGPQPDPLDVSHSKLNASQKGGLNQSSRDQSRERAPPPQSEESPAPRQPYAARPVSRTVPARPVTASGSGARRTPPPGAKKGSSKTRSSVKKPA